MKVNSEYQLYIEYMEMTEWGTRIDEFSIPSFLSKSVNFIKDLASKLSLKLTDVMKLFANKSVFQFFQKIKWNLDYLFKIIKDGHRAYTQIISAISEYVSKTKVGRWTEDKLKDLDKWLQNHPKLKRIGGIVVAGLLIYIWFNMTFIGDAQYDFNLTDVYAALSGKFSLSTLFAGQSGTQLLLLFVTGVIGISFPWPGPASVKFLYAMIKSLADWAKLKLQKEHIYKNMKKTTMKLTELLTEWRAEDVLKQLGGRKFIAMTGAKQFVRDDKNKAIMFKIPKAKNGINYIRITLTSMDLYDIEFMAFRGTNVKTVAREKGIYNDQLQSVFTKNTGLYTSL
jgi:hypothetical protein